MILTKNILEELEENHSYWNDNNYISLLYDGVNRELKIIINFTTVSLSELSSATCTFLISNNNADEEN
jgi:hypothetical protein